MTEVPGDSGRSGPVTSESPVVSEHRLDQEVELNLKEDHEIEVDVLKASFDLLEEKAPISDDPPDTQEIHVKIIIFYFLILAFEKLTAVMLLFVFACVFLLILIE